MSWEIAVNLGAAVGIAALIWKTQMRIEDRIDKLSERVAKIEGFLFSAHKLERENE